MANLKWTKDKKTGAYSSVTGRWVISKNDKNGWTLVDTKNDGYFEGLSLKACQGIAENIFFEEEKLKSDAKETGFNNFQPVEARPLSTSGSAISNLTPVPAKKLL